MSSRNVSNQSFARALRASFTSASSMPFPFMQAGPAYRPGGRAVQRRRPRFGRGDMGGVLEYPWRDHLRRRAMMEFRTLDTA